MSAIVTSPVPAALLLSAALLCTSLERVEAQGNWRAGARHHVGWGGASTRAGDIMGFGIAIARDLGSRWTVSALVDRLEYDLETPVHATGIEPRAGDDPVDAFITVNRVGLDATWALREGGRWRPFVGAGIAAYAIDAGEARGNRADGGTFDLEVDTPTTAGVSASIGSEWMLGSRLRFGIAGSYAQTFSRYTVTDRPTGASGEISPLAPIGIISQISLRW
jgi:hypothetical protein